MKKEFLIAKVIARFPNGGRVIKYNVGEYNEKDIVDLVAIAKIKASNDGVIVKILPKIRANDNLYEVIFSDLAGTIYERKCPDLKIISEKDGRHYFEYESFARPFKPRDLSRMLARGSRQAASLIIDVRETNITPSFIRKQIFRNLMDPYFKRPINQVWTYNGDQLIKVWG